MDEYLYPLLVEGNWPDIKAKIVQSKVHIYFQSRKRSNGGDCVISWSGRSCTLLFKSQEVRDQVLAKAEHAVTIDQLVLKLKVSKPPSDSGRHTEETLQASATAGSDAQQAGGPDASAKGLRDAPWSKSVVLENVLENVGKDFLNLLVEIIVGSSEMKHSIEFISESNAAVVTFNDPSAIEKFLKECRKNKMFCDKDLKARRLENIRTVRVEKLPARCTENCLKLYFDKYDGGVEKIKLIDDEQAALITFTQPQVLEVFRRNHTISGTAVDIYPFVPSLVSALYGKDRPAWTLPKPFMDKIHPAITEFLLMKEKIPVICNQMSSYFCEMTMDKDKVMFSPLPGLLRQKDINIKHIDNWNQDTMKAFKRQISFFDVFEYDVSPSVWRAVEKDVCSVVKDKAFLKVDTLTGGLTLAGMAKDINTLKPILTKTFQDASAQMEREKRKTSDTLMIPPTIFFLLQYEGLDQTARARYPQLELTYNRESQQLSLTGLHVEIVEVKNEMLMRRINLTEKTLKINPLLVEFLGSVDFEEISRYMFTSQNIGAVYRFENGTIVLTASTDKELIEAEKRIDLMLELKLLHVEDSNVLKKKEWHELTKNLYEAYNLPKRTTVIIKSSEDRDKVVVCGFQEPVREISTNLEKFLETHTRVEETIRVKSYAVVKFIKDKKSQVWQKFLEGDTLSIQFESKRPLIRVSGERLHVQPALTAFQELARSLYIDRFLIRRVGAKKFFQEQGQLVLMMIKEERFVVVLEDDSMEEEDVTGNDVGQDSCEVKTPSGIVIKVLKADMCKLKADAVVNASNEDLQHIGGLALALLKAAGPSLQQSCNQYVAKHGILQTGNAIITEAGNLPCEYVVHAVGPRFNNTDKLTAVKQLKQVVRSSLDQAVLKKCSSIALPAISSGIFCFPLDLCTETIAQELRLYVDNQKHQNSMNTLKEILLVDNNPITVTAMVQAVQKEFKEFKQQLSQGSIHHGQKYQGEKELAKEYQEQGAAGDLDNEASAIDSQVHRTKENRDFKNPTPFKTPKPQFRPQLNDTEFDESEVLQIQYTEKGLKVVLLKADIQDAHSDVIVNTISEDLNLSQGAVSKAILKAAGPKLQVEVDQYLQLFGYTSLNFGDLIDTKGYNLNCKRVFHTICQRWSQDGSSEQILKQIIATCLNKAEELGMSSISFPAIGTGNLRFPGDIVCRILLNEIHAFSAKVSPQSLNEVAVIVHPSNVETVQCFVRGFRDELQSSVPRRAPAVLQSPAGRLPRAKSQQPAGFIGAVSTPSLGVHRIQIKHLTLEVASGDITKEICDAIVNSSNQAFTLRSGVSKAILDAAGLAVENECADIVAALSTPKDIIMTSGGQLPCKYIIHIVGRNNPADIKNVVYAVLKYCEEQKFLSVAFPALGTGQGGAQPSAVADAMIDALVEFVKKKKETHLKMVKFLVFQAPMVDDFYQCMAKKQQESVEDEGGFVDWVKGTFASMTSFLRGTTAEGSANKEFVWVGEEFEPVVFQLCGESEEHLKKARDLINSFIVKEHMDTKIEDSAINHFDQNESALLSNLQRKLTVSIQLSKSGPEPAFLIEGLTRDVMLAGEQIREMIRKKEKMLTRDFNAFKTAQLVEWQYQDHSGKFVLFDYLANFDLEEAFLVKQKSISISIENNPYKADLSCMRASGKRGHIKLKRTDLKDQNVSLPIHWEDMKKKVELQPTSQEYTDVEIAFRKTGLTSQILKIERIQNETLWKNYMNQKEHLEKKNKHKNNEKFLFHGTSADNIDKINMRGFDRSFAGLNGAMYGNGVYFAVDPRYSANGYAKADLNGHKRMYLARVLVGDFTIGKAGLLTPPTKSSTGTEQYDSVTDKQQSMFVIFHDDFAYPDHLITFQ